MSKFSALAPAVAIALSAVLLAAALGVFREEPQEVQGASAAGAPPAFRFAVTVAPLERGDFEETAELVGDVVSARRAQLAFERAGRVAALSVDVGHQVGTGDLLAELDNRMILAEQKVARAVTLAAEEEAAYADLEAQRANRVGDDIVPETDRDRLLSVAKTAAIKVQESLAQEEVWNQRLRQGRLTAPFNGILTERALTEGDYVQAGQPAFELVDLERREIRFEIPVAYRDKLEAGTLVRIYADERPGFEIAAQLDVILPATRPGERNFLAWVRLTSTQDPERVLLPGMFVRAQVQLSDLKDTWIAPADAVLEKEGTTSIVAVAPGVAESPPVAQFVPIRVLARNRNAVAFRSLQPRALDGIRNLVLSGIENVFPGAPLGFAEIKADTPTNVAPIPGGGQ